MYKRQAYNGEKIGQGRENAKQYLKEHPEIRDDVEKQVRIHYEDVYKRQVSKLIGSYSWEGAYV